MDENFDATKYKIVNVAFDKLTGDTIQVDDEQGLTELSQITQGPLYFVFMGSQEISSTAGNSIISLYNI